MSKLQQPNSVKLLGTDYLGRDVLEQTISAFSNFLIAIFSILVIIYFVGLVLGRFTGRRDEVVSGVLIRGFLRVWINVPILLLVTIGLILIGPSLLNLIALMAFFLIPSQVIFYLNTFDEVKQSKLITSKQALGFDGSFIGSNYIYPLIRKRYVLFTFSRLPEIVLLDLGLNFIGVGASAEIATFGHIFREGLPFMMAAWWMWVPGVVIVTLFILLARIIILRTTYSN